MLKYYSMAENHLWCISTYQKICEWLANKHPTKYICYANHQRHPYIMEKIKDWPPTKIKKNSLSD